MMEPCDQLRRVADMVESKTANYGSARFQHGKVMAALYPWGVNLLTQQDHDMYNRVDFLVTKLLRFTCSPDPMAQVDSPDDIMGHAALWAEAMQLYNALGSLRTGDTPEGATSGPPAPPAPRIHTVPAPGAPPAVGLSEGEGALICKKCLAEIDGGPFIWDETLRAHVHYPTCPEQRPVHAGDKE